MHALEAIPLILNTHVRHLIQVKYEDIETPLNLRTKFSGIVDLTLCRIYTNLHPPFIRGNFRP